MPIPMPETPVTPPMPAKEPVIYTIPDQFYGLAAKAQLPKAAAAPVPGAAPVAPSPPKAQGAQSKKWLLIPIIALVLLALLGFGAWWFLQPKPAPAPTAPSVTLPPAEPEPAPQPAPEPAPQPQPATTTTETPPPPAPQGDADGDGLTNAEEALYGTKTDNADTDADGFSDSVEVINLYNPAGFKPTKLIEAGLVKAFLPAGAAWELLVPSAWTPVAAGAGGAISYQIPTGQNELFIFTEEENPESKSALDFYLSQNPDASPSQAQSFTTKSGLDGVRTADGRSAFIAVGTKVVAFSRQAADGSAAGFVNIFPSTFAMMLNSVSMKP